MTTKQRNPNYDGKLVYIPIVERVLPGDVILTRNRLTQSLKARKRADVIARVSGSNFSHALICAVPPTLVEAIGAGVGNLSLSKCFSHSISDVRVLRHSNEQVAQAAGNWALQRLGEGYSAMKAVLSVLPNIDANFLEKGTFCSALVAAAYYAAGEQNFLGFNPYKVTPGTIERMTFFTDVTPIVFKEALAPRNIEDLYALDGDRAPSPLDSQAQLISEIYGYIKPIIVGAFHKFEISKDIFPETFFDTLQLVYMVLSDEGGSRLDPGVIAEFHRVDALLLSKMSDGGRLDDLYRSASALEADDLKRILAESFSEDPDIDTEQLRSILEVTRQQIQARESIFSEAPAEKTKSRSWGKWLEVQRSGIDALKARKSIFEEVLSRLG